METDGRIRSKDIGTGEVNSRVIDDLRSSNYDGSRIDPENDPGLNGWQILKSGFVVINDAIVRGTISAARIVSAVLESGTLNIRSGGSLTVGGDAEAGIDPLVTLDETGMQVGDDVVMDSTGLQVIGGYVNPQWIEDQADFVSNASLTTSLATQNSITFTPPSWVQTLSVEISIFAQATDGTAKDLVTKLVGGTAAAGGFQMSFGGAAPTNAASRLIHRTFTTFPVTIEQEANVTAGTNSTNRFDLVARAVGVRD